jgi:hypothetical protein
VLFRLQSHANIGAEISYGLQNNIQWILILGRGIHSVQLPHAVKMAEKIGRQIKEHYIRNGIDGSIRDDIVDIIDILKAF